MDVPCAVFSPEMLPYALRVTMEGEESSFENARKYADKAVKTQGKCPMLLAWYDRVDGAFSPRVE